MSKINRTIAFTIFLFMINPGSNLSASLANEFSRLDWIWPADGTISDTYGTRSGKHAGVDVAAAINTPIYAVSSGVVTKSYYSTTYGNVVFIKHEEGYETVYAHLQKRLVAEGERVDQGQVIGTMGSTGKSSGPHLHFEIHKDAWTVHKENAIDPFLIFGQADVGTMVFARKRSVEEIKEVMKREQAKSGE